MSDKQDKILIAIPTFEHIQNETFKSIYGLLRPENTIVQFDYIKGYDVSRARNLIVKEALEYNFDYVFMVDSDIVLPRFALMLLYAQQKDIILGWYRRHRTKTGQTEWFSKGMKDFTDKNNINVKDLEGKTEPFELKGGGMGCSLIKTSIFATLGKNKWFQYIEYPDDAVLSEDNFFSSLATSKGFEIWGHPLVACGHVNKFVI